MLREEPLTHQDDELPRHLPPLQQSPDQFTLFEAPRANGTALEDLVAELQDQLAAVAASPQRARLQLLLAAESAGALIATEMEHSGVPWNEDIHLDILTSRLGERPREGQRPEKLEDLAVKLGQELANSSFSPDSPQQLIRALHRAGIEVKTTSSWELKEYSHPAIEPLLHYRSSPGCTPPMAGRGSTPGSRTAASGPSTLSAAWSPGAGRRAAAVPCRYPARSGMPSVPTPAGSSWSPMPHSWNPGCSPSLARTPPCRRRARPQTCTKGSPTSGSAATAPTQK